ncbi:MAG: hypothetical protein WC393_05680 [Candidatus Nanoarchaeia archaeon]|jgi:hypothetical protein
MKIEHLIDRLEKNIFKEEFDDSGELLKQRERILSKKFSAIEPEIKKLAKSHKSEIEKLMKKNFKELNINERLFYINQLISSNIKLEKGGFTGKNLTVNDLIELNVSNDYSKDYEFLNKKSMSKQLKDYGKLFDFDIRHGGLSTISTDFKQEFKSYMKEVLSDFFRKNGCLPGQNATRGAKNGSPVKLEDKDFEKLNDLIIKKTKKMENAYLELYKFLEELNEKIYEGKNNDFFYSIDSGIFLDKKSDFYTKKSGYPEEVYELLIFFSRKLLSFEKKLFTIKIEQKNTETMALDYGTNKTSFIYNASGNFFEFNASKINEKDFMELKIPDFEKILSNPNALIYFMSVMYRIKDIGDYPTP